jgi:hypothetical protein
MKRCGRCGAEKALSEYHRSARDGGYQSWCKMCRRTYDAAYHERVRLRRIEQKRQRSRELVEFNRRLKNGPCVDCGGNFHPAAMTWDHVPGTSKRAPM